MKSLKVSEEYPFRAFLAYYRSLFSGLVKKVTEGERLFCSLRASRRMNELTHSSQGRDAKILEAHFSELLRQTVKAARENANKEVFGPVTYSLLLQDHTFPTQ